MIEMTPQATATHLEAPRAEVVTYRLDPQQRLPIGNRDHTLYVAEGVVYVILGDDEQALAAGDQIGIRAGELQRAWNVSDSVARVVVTSRR
jgi:quercetin dioxygenase-like cupin family protein